MPTTSVFSTSGSSTSSASSTETVPRRINAVIKELAAAGASSFFFKTSSRALLGALLGMGVRELLAGGINLAACWPMELEPTGQTAFKIRPDEPQLLARGGGSRGTGPRSLTAERSIGD